MPYRYSMIRFVPDPGRGEFINIGAVAGDDDSGDWELRMIQNYKRAKAVDVQGALAVALGFVDSLEEHIAAHERLFDHRAQSMSSELLREWSEEMNNVVQVSSPAPLVADTAESALDLVFQEMVLDPASRTYRFEKKHRAVSNTRQSYRDGGVPDSALAQHAAVQTGPYSVPFDFAVLNGQVVQLVQCWSFQLPNQVELAEEVKAWAWGVHEIKETGGHFSLHDRKMEIKRSPEIFCVYVPPAPAQHAQAFEEAQAAFNEIEVEALPADAAEIVGQRAAISLGKG